MTGALTLSIHREARAYRTYAELTVLTEEAGGILEVSAGSLRELEEAGKLGRHVGSEGPPDLIAQGWSGRRPEHVVPDPF